MNSPIEKYKALWGVFLALAWSAVVLLLVQADGQLTVEQLLRYTPVKPLLAAAVLLGLFLLKGVDFLVHSGLLYAVCGVLFPAPVALGVSLLGTAVMLVPGFFTGRCLGAPVVAHIAGRHPRIAQFAHIPERGNFVLALLLRATGLPATAAGVYMGAADFRFVPYFFGSLLGLIPVTVAFTLMGAGIGDLSSPLFWAAFAGRWAIALLSMALAARVIRREKHRQEKDLT